MKHSKRYIVLSILLVIVFLVKFLLVDLDTGEIISVDQITKRVYGTRNFWKCYLMDFLSVLGIIDSKQLDIFIYICENTNSSDNIFIGTYKQIAEKVGCSQTTIAKIMKKLQENNFIKKKCNGVWMINANIMMKGNDHKRQMLLSYYNSPDPVNQISISRTQREEIPTDEAQYTLEAAAAVAEEPKQIEEKGD